MGRWCWWMWVAWAGVAWAQQPVERPNIIFILTDDQRWDALGYAGNPVIQTPEMDRLARAGTYFSHAMVSTPICSASRASILTGLYERTHRYTFQTGPLPDRFLETAYPRLLRAAGYVTGFFGKLGVKTRRTGELFDVSEVYDRNGRYPDRRGYYYKKLDGEVVHLTRYTGQKALDFIASAPADRPFCLSLSFSAPHAHDNAPEQYIWQPSTDGLYQGMSMPGPRLAEDAYFEELPAAVRAGFNRTRWTWRFDTPAKYQHSVKGYYRMIRGVDLEIGKIRAALAARGLDRNTVIVLMGDNGYFLGERQLAGKWLMYDNSLRVPLIVYDPRVGQHRDVTDMALNVDVPATILDLAGVPVPDAYHGRSLLPVVTRGASLEREAVLVEHLWPFDKIPPSEGLRTADWKYFHYVDDQSLAFLYHLADDPEETRNLAGDPAYAGTLAALRRRCEDLMVAHRDPQAVVPSGLTVAFIRDPNGVAVQDPQPEYSWIVPATAGYQQAYRILVASSRAALARNQGDVWDSGPVRSRRSVQVSHGGPPLAPETTYYWKVRIWDRDNRLSEDSAVQRFRTGRFDEDGVTANRPVIERIAPVAVTRLDDGTVCGDFGRDAFGTLALDYRAAAPETLTLRLGEKRTNGRIDTKPGGSIRFQELSLEVSPERTHYVVALPADKRNTGPKAVPLAPELGVVMPFRYVEIAGARQPIRAADLRQRALFHYWQEDESAFSCSDPVLQQVWDLCKYSMKATSFTGLYIDGDRERIPYEADAYINQLGHYAVDREYAMARRTLAWFLQHPTWPTEWLLHTALLAYADYQYTGDLEFVAAHYESLKAKTLMALAREDGLISVQSPRVTAAFMREIGFADPKQRLRDIVDWPPGQKDTGWKLARPAGERDGYDMRPVNTVVNCFFFRNMEILADLAARLGRSEDALRFTEMAARVRCTINTRLFDGERGVYVDGEGSTHASLHANMMPLAFGLVPAEHRDSVVAFVKSRGMACSVYGAQYLLEALYRAGEAQAALDLMRAEDDRGWFNMIRTGSTITLEAWDMKYKPNADWNHAWGAVPANMVARGLWGIRPAEPGFAVARIQPQPANLTETSIRVPTLRGPIEAAYRRVSGRLRTYRVVLPGNMAAEFVPPGDGPGVITVDGREADPAFASVRLGPGEHRIEIEVHSF